MLVIGLILLFFGLSRINKNNKLTFSGILIAGFPFGIILAYLLYNLFFELFTSKPDQKDIVGIYSISETRNLAFDKSKYKNYQLELKNDGTFILTKTPYINCLCDTGMYKVDYHFEDNESTLNLTSINQVSFLTRNLSIR